MFINNNLYFIQSLLSYIYYFTLEMTFLQYKKENQYIEPDGQSSLVFFGGEPLLLYDKIIVPLTEYINKNY